MALLQFLKSLMEWMVLKVSKVKKAKTDTLRLSQLALTETGMLMVLILAYLLKALKENKVFKVKQDLKALKENKVFKVKLVHRVSQEKTELQS